MRARSPVEPRLDRLGEAHARGTSSRTRVPPAAPGPRLSRAADRRRALAHERDAEVAVAGAAVVARAQAAAVVLDREGQRAVRPPSRVTSTRPAPAWRSTLASASPSTRRTTAVDLGLGGLDRRAGAQLDGQPALARAVAGGRDRVVQAADRHARGEVLQARADDAVRRAHRLAQARAALAAWAGAGSESSSAISRLASARSWASPSWISAARRRRSRSTSVRAMRWRRRAAAMPAPEQVAEDGEHRRAGLLQGEGVALRGGDHARGPRRPHRAAAPARPRRAGRTGWPRARWPARGRRARARRPRPAATPPARSAARRAGRWRRRPRRRRRSGAGSARRRPRAGRARRRAGRGPRTSPPARARPARSRVPAPTSARATEPTAAIAAGGWTAAGGGASAATGDRRDRLPAMRWTRRPVSVLVVDDHRLMREGTAALLRADERVEVAGLARDGREALALAAAPRARRRPARPRHARARRASRRAPRCASAIPTSRC